MNFAKVRVITLFQWCVWKLYMSPFLKKKSLWTLRGIEVRPQKGCTCLTNISQNGKVLSYGSWVPSPNRQRVLIRQPVCGCRLHYLLLTRGFVSSCSKPTPGTLRGRCTERISCFSLDRPRISSNVSSLELSSCVTEPSYHRSFQLIIYAVAYLHWQEIHKKSLFTLHILNK